MGILDFNPYETSGGVLPIANNRVASAFDRLPSGNQPPLTLAQIYQLTSDRGIIDDPNSVYNQGLLPAGQNQIPQGNAGLPSPAMPNAAVPPQPAPQMAAGGGGGLPVPGGGYGMNNPLQAGFAGFANAGGGLLPMISNLIGGLATGQRQDKKGMATEQLAMQQQAAFEAALQQGATVPQARAFAMSGKPPPTPELTESGTDLMGNKSFIQKNPFTGTVSPVVINGAVGGLGGLSQVPINYGPDGKDTGFIAALEKEDKITAQDVRAVVEGKMPATGRNLQKIMQLAARYDQNFTGAQDFQTRLQTAKSFAAGGKDSAAVKSMDQAIIHANKVWDLIPKIEGVNIGGIAGKIVNVPYGEARAATNPQFASDRNEYSNLVQALSGELMTASRGSGHGSLEEVRAWKSGALAANSGAEMRGAIRGAMDFLDGAMIALSRKKSEGMKSQFEPTSLISEENQRAFEKIHTSSESGQSTVPQQSSGPVKVKSPAEANKLKPGTHYLTPDGKEYIR